MDWLPNAEQIIGNSAGSMNGDGSRKILLHSTEGSTIEGAVGAYEDNNSWPHLTIDCRRRRIAQHVAFGMAARALRNEAGGVETNRDGSILVQIELVGFAGDPGSIGALVDLDWLGGVIAQIARATGVPLFNSLTWAPYPNSYGTHAAQRLSGPVWDRYSGLVGHQHVPENSHGDPGAIDITRILTAARKALNEEDGMDIADLRKELTTGGTPTRSAIRELTKLGTRDALTTGGDPARTAVLELVRKAVVEDGATRRAIVGLVRQAIEET
jgi:hypothetical protein